MYWHHTASSSPSPPAGSSPSSAESEISGSKRLKTETKPSAVKENLRKCYVNIHKPNMILSMYEYGHRQRSLGTLTLDGQPARNRPHQHYYADNILPKNNMKRKNVRAGTSDTKII